MPVNSTHPDYDFGLPGWLRARDVLAGEDAVKSAGEKYLPRLDSQSDEEFLAYRKRASFFNTTARSAEGFVGLIFRRPPFVKIPEGKSIKDKGKSDGAGAERRSGEPKLGMPSTPYLSGPKLVLPKRGEGEIPGGRVCVPNAATIWIPQFTKPLRGTWSQGSSFLATAGLICETRFGVFKMARRGHEWWAKVEGL
jgi:hypothetical protein